MKILITGAAGFIGFHAVVRFVSEGYEVIGLDNINNYYQPKLKFDRLKECGILKSCIKPNILIKSKKWKNYSFIKLDLQDGERFFQFFQHEEFDFIIHLAGQAGVRYSLINPQSYISSNIVGFMNILEACKIFSIKRLFYASSSSVYGLSSKKTLSVKDRVDNPISLYAATKKSNELMAHVYSHLYQIQTFGLRFFTVYGPWGRPDMAPFIFTESILNNKEIKVFNNGKMRRDFTFIDDIIDGLFEISKIKIDSRYNIFNLGHNSPIKILDFIKFLEKELNKKANKKMSNIQKGDVVSTCADMKEFIKLTGYQPKTNVRKGIKIFVDWYKNYYK